MEETKVRKNSNNSVAPSDYFSSGSEVEDNSDISGDNS